MNVKDSDNIIEAAKLMRTHILESPDFLNMIFERLSSILVLENCETNYTPMGGLEIKLETKNSDGNIQSSEYVGTISECILNAIVEANFKGDDRLKDLLDDRSIISSLINVIASGPSSIVIKI
jgi:hypothetical protein